MESASLLSRESTTLSFSNPQKGHFMRLVSLGNKHDCSREMRPEPEERVAIRLVSVIRARSVPLRRRMLAPARSAAPARDCCALIPLRVRTLRALHLHGPASSG